MPPQQRGKFFARLLTALDDQVDQQRQRFPRRKRERRSLMLHLRSAKYAYLDLAHTHAPPNALPTLRQ
jgi:hypothetical protein